MNAPGLLPVGTTAAAPHNSAAERKSFTCVHVCAYVSPESPSNSDSVGTQERFAAQEVVLLLGFDLHP